MEGVKLSRYGPELTHLLFADDMVLIAEASEEQIRTVKTCLNLFELISGQKVSLHKSQIFFSKNVEPSLADRITQQAGIDMTKDLGRYLGVPSVHGRVTRNMFTSMMDKVDTRLEGWKTKHLTLAGRIVLAKSVLSAIPFYTMQSMFIPKGVCEAIERKIRKFIWGKSPHLVRWERVTMPKDIGGLGIKNLKEMNLAFLSKLGWRIIYDNRSLWTRTITAKYMKGINNLQNITWKSGGSNIWKGICEARGILATGLRRTEENEATFIAGGLNREGNNVIHWNPENDGRFTVASAYAIASEAPVTNNKEKWKDIWKLQVPNKVCIFIWILKQRRLMTNVERSRRGLTTDTRCPLCGEYNEDDDHCIRKCVQAAEIWEVFLPFGAKNSFFTLDFDCWLTLNVTGNMNRNTHDKWGETFALVAWWIWKWRCKKVFNEEDWDIKYKIGWLRQAIEETKRVFNKKRVIEHHKIERDDLPQTQEDWSTLHVDASFITPNRPTGCGGVLRNSKGEWIRGFSCTTKTDNAIEGELWAIYTGLSWAWNMGIKKLQVFSDSKHAIDWVTKGPRPLGPCALMVDICKEWSSKQWEVAFYHIKRDFNEVADRLAKVAPGRSCEWIEFMQPPTDVCALIENDCVRRAFTRKSQ